MGTREHNKQAKDKHNQTNIKTHKQLIIAKVKNIKQTENKQQTVNNYQ